MLKRIKKGLNIPLAGAPSQEIDKKTDVTKVALLGSDYVGMKPTMLVKVGDSVKLGTPLFKCKKVEGVIYTSPAAGKVIEINRGERRVFQSIVIKMNKSYEEAVDCYEFSSFNAAKSLSEKTVKNLLVESGMWPSFRTRPFSKAPKLDSKPNSIFINTMNTQPHAPDSQLVLMDEEDSFKFGLEVVSHLTEGKLYVCKKAGAKIPKFSHERAQYVEFDGPHPAGNVGTHIHTLDPVDHNKQVWHISYQDIIAIGELFKTGKLRTTKLVSLSGPQVKKPRLIKTRIGACLSELCSGELNETQQIKSRLISGSVLNGNHAQGAFNYLGKFHEQVTVLEEGEHRELLGWHSPGFSKFSHKPIYVSKLMPKKLFSFNTNLNGSERALVPTGNYESVMPLDIIATPLLKSLLSKDTDSALELGALELDEEDLSLCTYVCSGKNDYGSLLRAELEKIEKEG